MFQNDEAVTLFAPAMKVLTEEVLVAYVVASKA